MTEADFTNLLKTKYGASDEVLKHINSPEFPTVLFREVDPRRAHVLLCELFREDIEKGKEFCEPEKTLVRAIKLWPEKSEQLAWVCGCFFDKELRPKVENKKRACR